MNSGRKFLVEGLQDVPAPYGETNSCDAVARIEPRTAVIGADDMQAFLKFAESLRDLRRQAAQQFQPVVDDILRTRSRDTEHIEHTLERLLDFCGDEAVLQMYRKLCRHYWDIDPAATAYYVKAYREYWDSDEQGIQP